MAALLQVRLHARDDHTSAAPKAAFLPIIRVAELRHGVPQSRISCHEAATPSRNLLCGVAHLSSCATPRRSHIAGGANRWSISIPGRRTYCRISGFEYFASSRLWLSERRCGLLLAPGVDSCAKP